MKSTHMVHTLVLAAAFSAAAQTQIDLRTQGKNIDFSGSSSTKPFRTGTEMPAACSLGETFFKTDAPAGENLYACTATDVWTLESGASGVPGVSGRANSVLSNNGVTADWRALGGDITGAPDAAVVSGIQGRGLSPAAPADGQVLRWNGVTAQWQPFPVALPGGANYSQAFAGQTLVTIPGSAHGLGTASLIVECYDGSTPAVKLTPASVTVHPATYDVTVAFGTAQSGRCVVNGSGASYSASTTGSNTFAAGTTQTFQGALIATSADRTAPVKAGSSLPGTCTAGDQFFKTNAAPGQNLYFCTGTNAWTQMAGSQLVTSVFGRTGAVAAATGDYSFPQIAGTIANSQLAAGIDAVKIGAGTVNNTVLGYMANVTGDVQSQLANKAGLSHSHTAAGDATGDLGTMRVAAIQGHAVSPADPGDGQALVWNASGNNWQPGTVAGGGGAATTSQLSDFVVTRTSATVLTVGANCSPATPCNVRFGTAVYSFTRGCTATLGAPTAMAYVYIAPEGTLTIGHNATVSASAGCLAQPNVTNFPADSIPLYGWTATGSAWDIGGGRDYRALLSAKGVSAGTGIATVESAGRTTVSVDTAAVPMYLTGSAAIDFPAIGNGACAAEQTFPVYGASVGDAVAPGWPGALEAGLFGTMRISTANTVAVRVCNLSGGTVDPASATFRATVVRSF